MNCLLIFDHVNDIIFTKYNDDFEKHIKEFATSEGLTEASEDGDIDPNIIVQIFAPIIASHRIMNCQFGNSYTSIQCEDELTIHFVEYMGYLFVSIGNGTESSMQKFISICVTIVRYLCGPDVYQLKSEEKSNLAKRLIDSWSFLYANYQTILVEAIEQLVVNAELSSATIKILKESVDKLAIQMEYNRIHTLILVHDKLLSLYSSQSAKELSPADIIFLTILCRKEPNEREEDESLVQDISSYQILLAGSERHPKCLPHAIHIVTMSKGVHLLYLLEVGNPTVAASLYDTFCHLHAMQQVQIQREKQTLQPAYENLDLAIKNLNDSLKKNKNSAIENCHKQIVKKWDVIKKKYQGYLKNASEEALLRAETLTLGFLETLKELLSLTAVDESVLKSSLRFVKEGAKGVKNKLDTFEAFLKAKSMRNFSLGSYSLTINKYLEEFPGLVHFIYLDRTTHRITTPTLDFTTGEGAFSQKKIWFMINFSRLHLQEGNMSLMWKDTAFNYSYFLWFEDASGAPLKPAIFPSTSLPLPGIFYEDFYIKLKEICFPKTASNKIRCYELFCIHLGLVTASCVLEQTRRLSATVWELKGHPSQAIDLL